MSGTVRKHLVDTFRYVGSINSKDNVYNEVEKLEFRWQWKFFVDEKAWKNWTIIVKNKFILVVITSYYERWCNKDDCDPFKSAVGSHIFENSRHVTLFENPPSIATILVLNKVVPEAIEIKLKLLNNAYLNRDLGDDSLNALDINEIKNKYKTNSQYPWISYKKPS